MNLELARTIQLALLGEVPPTLRFVYVWISDGTLNFHAVLADDATEDHIEALRCVSTEVMASQRSDIKLIERIEIDNSMPWRIGNGNNLMYLRWGELSDA
jgi:hypothetical protein